MQWCFLFSFLLHCCSCLLVVFGGGGDDGCWFFSLFWLLALCLLLLCSVLCLCSSSCLLLFFLLFFSSSAARSLLLSVLYLYCTSTYHVHNTTTYYLLFTGGGTHAHHARAHTFKTLALFLLSSFFPSASQDSGQYPLSTREKTHFAFQSTQKAKRPLDDFALFPIFIVFRLFIIVSFGRLNDYSQCDRGELKVLG